MNELRSQLDELGVKIVVKEMEKMDITFLRGKSFLLIRNYLMKR